jgi:hypothetical protein
MMNFKVQGISREQSWIQSAPPGGSQGILDFEVLSMELELLLEYSKNLLHLVFIGQ